MLESLEVDFVTLHIEPNYRFESNLKLIGVTVLTSLTDEDLVAAGYNAPSKELVKRRAKLARDLGFSGVVCSGLEVREVRQIVGEKMLIFVPGVRPSWSRHDDQKRVVTPREAVENGADYIIIGRPIRDAKDPLKVIEMVEKELKEV